ncbi:MAG: hypothetical protein ACE5Q6_20795, partial [Dehalococcoidia bacterium]
MRRTVWSFIVSVVAAIVAMHLWWPQTWLAFSSAPAIHQDFVYASYQFNTLKHPTGLAVLQPQSSTIQLWIADTGNHVIRRFSSGILSIEAGTGNPGYADGSPTQAQFDHPTGLLVLDQSYQRRTRTGTIWVQYLNIYLNDAANYVVRLFCRGSRGTCSNEVRTVAGSHTKGFSDGASSSAQFATVAGIARKPGTSDYYICDAENHSIRKWNGTDVTTFAGGGTAGLVNGYRLSALFNCPGKVTWDNSGNMYVA